MHLNLYFSYVFFHKVLCKGLILHTFSRLFITNETIYRKIKSSMPAASSKIPLSFYQIFTLKVIMLYFLIFYCNLSIRQKLNNYGCLLLILPFV